MQNKRDPVETPADALTAPGDAEAQLNARVAYYYYIGGMTQQEIADRLNLTRMRVNRIVGQARSDGLVQVEVKLPLASCVAWEEKLKARLGLVDVTVVPTIPDPDAQQQAIGEAAGVMLDPMLREGIALGVGWGRTLRAAVRRITARKLGASHVAALMGGLTRGSGTNTFEVATEFARAIGAECYYVAAPIYCPSVESRSVLLTHYGLAEVMRRARECAVAIVSCGDLTRRSLLATTHIVSECIPGLQAAGAVGDLLGSYLDEYGRPVDHPLNSRVMALPLEEFKNIPATILASGGSEKMPIVRAILRAGLVNRLVTDETTAEGLI